MARKKDSDKPLILTEMTKEQLIEFAVEKGIEVDEGLEAEGIIEILLEAYPALEAGYSANDDITDKDTAVQDDKNESPPVNDNCEIGTIRTVKGVEVVKIGDNNWVNTVRENLEEGNPVVVVSKKRAGKTIFAKSGKPITFDENGQATVSAVDGQYLESIIIDGVSEYTVGG